MEREYNRLDALVEDYTYATKTGRRFNWDLHVMNFCAWRDEANEINEKLLKVRADIDFEDFVAQEAYWMVFRKHRDELVSELSKTRKQMIKDLYANDMESLVGAVNEYYECHCLSRLKFFGTKEFYIEADMKIEMAQDAIAKKYNTTEVEINE